ILDALAGRRILESPLDGGEDLLEVPAHLQRRVVARFHETQQLLAAPAEQHGEEQDDEEPRRGQRGQERHLVSEAAVAEDALSPQGHRTVRPGHVHIPPLARGPIAAPCRARARARAVAPCVPDERSGERPSDGSVPPFQSLETAFLYTGCVQRRGIRPEGAVRRSSTYWTESLGFEPSDPEPLDALVERTLGDAERAVRPGLVSRTASAITLPAAARAADDSCEPI